VGKTGRTQLVGRYYDELNVGDRFTTHGRTVTETDIVQFLNLSRNLEPQFSNREFYEKSWIFGKLACPGGLTFTFMTGLFTHLGLLSGTGEGYLGLDEMRLPAPLFCGDTVTFEVEVLEKKISRNGRGIVTMGFTGRNQNGETVLTCRQVFVLAVRAEK
jgi:acyl dehydratase